MPRKSSGCSHTLEDAAERIAAPFQTSARTIFCTMSEWLIPQLMEDILNKVINTLRKIQLQVQQMQVILFWKNNHTKQKMMVNKFSILYL